ncbi:MAG: class III signal peptide-containing protein [Candidatus Micrarchaeota archaeon]
MRAQVSLEFLILLAAFVAFLTIWVPLVFGVRQAGEDALSREYAKLALADIKNAADEVCILGKNNAREIELNLRGKWKMSVEGSEIRIDNGATSFTEKTKCAMERDEFELDGRETVVIKNDGEFVSVELA